LSIPAEIKKPKAHFINVISENYRLGGKKLVPYTDSNGITIPLDSWLEIVTALNRHMKRCVNGKMIRTFYKDDTGIPISPPSGVHIFEAPSDITEGLIEDALKDANNLPVYWNPVHRANNRMHMVSWSNHLLPLL
jgi:hypothetical protein